MSEQPKYVDTLATATSVAFGPVGVAATLTKETVAYQSAVADGDIAVTHFEWLLQNGTAAARVYAAFGLHDVAAARGLAVLTDLEHDDAPVTHVNGCFVMDSTVADVVRSIRGIRQAPAEPRQQTSVSVKLFALAVWGAPVVLLAYGAYSCAAH